MIAARRHRFRWTRAACLGVIMAGLAGGGTAAHAAPHTVPANVTPALAELAERAPERSVNAIVTAASGFDATVLVRAAGVSPGDSLDLINGVQAKLGAAEAVALAKRPGIAAVTLNGTVKSQGHDGDPHKNRMATAFNQSIGSDKLWSKKGGTTGQGIGIAVIDTGIAGDHTDFRRSAADETSRVVASAVIHPDATTPGDLVGHGTHVAGLIAGNGATRPASSPLDGRYVGVAPDADLINVKVSDDSGSATVADVINGLQFVVDKKQDFNIRVANLSLTSTVAQSYRIDPLAAAAEQAWFAGVTVVAASGNSGPDSVDFAPGNDPYVISVGGVDDQNTKDLDDDSVAPWSSSGVTQDGFRKPELMAPGARLVAPLAPGAAYAAESPDNVVDGEYLRLGGTSMAAAVASGAAALLSQTNPAWTPDQVKGALISRARDVEGVGTEIAVDDARRAAGDDLLSNRSLTPSSLIDPATLRVDPLRAKWGGFEWLPATGSLRAKWGSAGYVFSGRDVLGLGQTDPLRAKWGGADPTRAKWGSVDSARAKWGLVDLSASFTR